MSAYARAKWQAAAVSAEPRGDYSWLFDLVATDPVIRHLALARHQALLAAANGALHRSNALWAAHYRSRSSQTRPGAALDQANADFRWHQEQTIYGPLHAFRDAADGDDATRALWAPIAALSLRWEAEYPDEWGAPESWMWSRWGTKEAVLRRFDRAGCPEDIQPEIAELVLAALRRPYRCKDWMYACLVRHLDDRCSSTRWRCWLRPMTPRSGSERSSFCRWPHTASNGPPARAGDVGSRQPADRLAVDTDTSRVRASAPSSLRRTASHPDCPTPNCSGKQHGAVFEAHHRARRLVLVGGCRPPVFRWIVMGFVVANPESSVVLTNL
ncbi:hypothetical protein O7631_18115 [Micromonospora sp. WMMD967]|uniref:hypothetical protein n=1 Tax=Micromonospora sp. WMMD967 TaxID=3016101 RepID=UPI002417F617|nr:hypothetical protein [Micromonospora sp. WMMD967]MDG4838436.1 hypothetical protein [Micromonospora sp. WMMD967]